MGKNLKSIGVSDRMGGQGAGVVMVGRGGNGRQGQVMMSRGGN